jgi:hypothetical protein
MAAEGAAAAAGAAAGAAAASGSVVGVDFLWLRVLNSREV